MHLKILHFSGGLKTSRVVEKLLFTYLGKQIPLTDSWRQVDSDFHPLLPALSLVSLLESYLWFETATPRADIQKRPSEHLSMHKNRCGRHLCKNQSELRKLRRRPVLSRMSLWNLGKNGIVRIDIEFLAESTSPFWPR